jgi:hypothetical protein
MPETADTRVQVRLEPTIARWLEDRSARMLTGKRGGVQAREELRLWRATLAEELRRLQLTLGEASCIAEVMNGTVLAAAISTGQGAGLVFAECYDAFRLSRRDDGVAFSSYGAKWGIDEEALLGKLRNLGPAADHALADAMSRCWQWGAEASADGFARVGLAVTGNR